MKRITKLILSLIMLIFLTSCQTNQSKVYVFIYDMNDPFITALSDHITRIGENYYPMQTHDAKNSQIIQNEEIERVLELNPRLLIINPVDRLGAYPIINKAKSMDIPIIFINREPLEVDLDLYDHAFYVGAKAEQSGILQAEIVSDLFGNQPTNLNKYDLNDDGIIQTLIFKGEQGHQDAELRTEFIISTLTDDNFQVEILKTNVSNWNQDIAYKDALELLPQYENQFELIISNNDAMAIGVIRAMIELSMFVDTNSDGYIDKENEPWYPVIGIDGIDEAVEWIQTGHLYATVLNDASNQAYATIALARVILEGIDPETVDIDIVDEHYVWVDYKKYSLVS
ncbi:MAG: galactose ABC transporter substrate-binding protein [Acholeplasmataceae bacterium]|nr:galactose ABC transporter substrate-binding protein [Acholeplasmataceae bacterium]